MLQTLRDVVLLGLLCAPCALLLLLNSEPDGVGPYVDEIADNANEIWCFIRYIVLVVAYAMLLEGVLRLIQLQLKKHLSTVPLVIIVAAIYGLTHLKFHLLGFVYAFAVGLITACYFHRTMRLWSLVIWHACWELAAISFVILSGKVRIGSRHLVNCELIQSGLLCDLITAFH